MSYPESDEGFPFKVTFIQKSYIKCWTVTQNTSGRVFGRVLHVESKHMTSAMFCYFSNIDIFQSQHKAVYVPDKLRSIL